jgi:hypothetical protein
MMIETISVFDVPDYHAFKTQSGRWFMHRSNGYCGNEFGLPETYYNGCRYGPIVEVRPDFPYLSEDEPFEICVPKNITNFDFARKVLPNSKVMFKTDQDFRFRIELRNYRIAIGFMFDTTDARAPRASAQWTASSGAIWRHLVNNSLAIKWVNNEIILSVFHKMMDGTRIEIMTIKSGQ